MNEVGLLRSEARPEPSANDGGSSRWKSASLGKLCITVPGDQSCSEPDLTVPYSSKAAPSYLVDGLLSMMYALNYTNFRSSYVVQNGQTVPLLP